MIHCQKQLQTVHSLPKSHLILKVYISNWILNKVIDKCAHVYWAEGLGTSNATPDTWATSRGLQHMMQQRPAPNKQIITHQKSYEKDKAYDDYQLQYFHTNKEHETIKHLPLSMPY